MICLFYEWEDCNVASYGDYATPYSCATDIRSVALELRVFGTKLFGGLKLTI